MSLDFDISTKHFTYFRCFSTEKWLLSLLFFANILWFSRKLCFSEPLMMNIAAVIRLHFIPESEGGSPELYRDIHFEKDKYSSDIWFPLKNVSKSVNIHQFCKNSTSQRSSFKKKCLSLQSYNITLEDWAQKSKYKK